MITLAEPATALAVLVCEGCDQTVTEDELPARDFDDPVICPTCAAMPDDRAEYRAYAYH